MGGRRARCLVNLNPTRPLDLLLVALFAGCETVAPSVLMVPKPSRLGFFLLSEASAGPPRAAWQQQPGERSQRCFSMTISLVVQPGATLVSTDLIIRNARGEVLLGLRNNEPTKELFFVPGGIIRKQERLHEAAGISRERPITTRGLRTRSSSAFMSISMMPTALAMRILALTMSCWRMNSSLPMRLHSNLTRQPSEMRQSLA